MKWQLFNYRLILMNLRKFQNKQMKTNDVNKRNEVNSSFVREHNNPTHWSANICLF